MTDEVVLEWEGGRSESQTQEMRESAAERDRAEMRELAGVRR